MDLLAKKTPGEKEDEEAARLVRPLPKKKPPRNDLRRENMRVERDTDTSGDPDLSGDRDLSLNYKSIGGALAERVARKFLAAEDRVKVRRKDTGKVVEVSQESLKGPDGAQYERYQEEDSEKGSQPTDLHSLAKGNAKLETSFKEITNPKTDLGGLAEGNPSLPVSALFKDVKFPPEIKTLGDLREALQVKPLKGKKPTPESPKAPKEEPQPTQKAPETSPPKEPSSEAPKEESLPPPEDLFDSVPDPEEGKKKEIPPPKRKPASKAEMVKAMDLLLETFPPTLAGKFFKYHPEDIQSLVSSYNRFKGLSPKDLESTLENTHLFTLDPTKVNQAPKMGRVPAVDEEGDPKTSKDGSAILESRPFEDLSSSEKSEAMQRYRFDVVAASIVTRSHVAKGLAQAGIPAHVAPRIADVTLSVATAAPEERPRKAKEAARTLFVQASTGYLGSSDTEEVDERFGSSKKTSQPPALMSEPQKKNFLKAVSKLEPHAQMAAIAHLQGEDYRAAWLHFLSSHSPDRISERDSPAKIYQKLTRASEMIQRAGRLYPREIRDGLDDPAAVFRTRVRDLLRNLSPEKEAFVAESFSKADADAYDKNLRRYEKELQAYRKAYAKYQEQLKAWEASKVEGSEGAYRSNGNKPAPPRPRQPVEPLRPVKPPMYEKHRPASKEEQAEIQQHFDEVHSRRVASLYSSYHTQNSQMGTSEALRAAVRTAIYHGIDPTLKSNGGKPSYPDWHQVHQRDLGSKDFDVLLTAAKRWLKSPVLSKQIEGMVPDARFRAALDLAISDAEDGKYNHAISAPIYNMLLAKLASQPAGQTLETIREAGSHVGGLSPTTETKETVMTDKLAKEVANPILSRLDKLATSIQDNHAKWGMSFETAKAIVNEIDRSADEIEKAAFGEDSLKNRQLNVLVQAKVIQQDSNEPYMGTFNAPMAPHQTDSDEPYMGMFKDDQSTAVEDGKSTTGRPLSP